MPTSKSKGKIKKTFIVHVAHCQPTNAVTQKVCMPFLRSKPEHVDKWEFSLGKASFHRGTVVQIINVCPKLSKISKKFKIPPLNLNFSYTLKLSPLYMNEEKWKKVLGNKIGILIYSWTLWFTRMKKCFWTIFGNFDHCASVGIGFSLQAQGIIAKS